MKEYLELEEHNWEHKTKKQLSPHHTTPPPLPKRKEKPLRWMLARNYFFNCVHHLFDLDQWQINESCGHNYLQSVFNPFLSLGTICEGAL